MSIEQELLHLFPVMYNFCRATKTNMLLILNMMAEIVAYRNSCCLVFHLLQSTSLCKSFINRWLQLYHSTHRPSHPSEEQKRAVAACRNQSVNAQPYKDIKFSVSYWWKHVRIETHEDIPAYATNQINVPTRICNLVRGITHYLGSFLSCEFLIDRYARMSSAQASCQKAFVTFRPTDTTRH